MEIRVFNNLLIRIFGGLLIYNVFFNYTIGAVFKINNEHTKLEQLNWTVILLLVLFFVFFIKKTNALSCFVYRKNYFFELNSTNQYFILRFVFLSFIIISLSDFREFFHDFSLWNSITTSTIMSLSLILFYKKIISYFINKINLPTNKYPEYTFVFGTVTLLFYFNFFRDFNFGLPKLHYFLFHLFFLFISFCSPFLFQFFIKKNNKLTNTEFTYILFFWMLFLYNLQEFIFKLPNYEEDNIFLLKDILFNVIMPFCFFIFYKSISKIKSITIQQFTFYIIGIFMISISAYKYLYQGTGYGLRYYYFWVGLIMFFLPQLKIVSKFLSQKRFLESQNSDEIDKSNNPSFLIVTFLMFYYFNYIRSFHHISNNKINIESIFSYSLPFIIILIELILLVKLSGIKKLKSNDLTDLINVLIISVSIILIFNFSVFSFNNHIFNNIINLPINNFAIVMFPILLTILFFSSRISQVLKKVFTNH
ncbi:MAG: hypothetical protein O9267_01905 [Flavobacterium sp.]|uniref:hypothetical protein n=1 Tax=Flavobacterium sp. TaxID=239 RepID=UPI0022CCC138|nr:hypothetical protein [Flavobacterium sp.]MCZ8196344.1 hypothetical protein [Flavobacterium sp.]